MAHNREKVSSFAFQKHRGAKELMHEQMVTDEATMWAGTAEKRQTALEEYQAEIDEIIASLSSRTESNRAETIDCLKQLAIPNQFNKQQTTTPTPN